MIEEIYADLESQMNETIRSLQRDLSRVRTGRATPALLDGVIVDYYGTDTPLIKLATVSVPDARLLVVQPFDTTAINAIEKGIHKAELGLAPINDGKVIKVPVPDLTEERRKDLVKVVRKEGEKHKISVRNHRRDALDMLKQLEAEKEISEDDHRKAHDRVQALTDQYSAKVEEVVKSKEAEVMAV